MGNKLQKLADEKWSEMMSTLTEKGADFAFDVFYEALEKAQDLVL